ncbi:Fic family protein [bacterium]|nr:Fic family protein [bacterium]
MYLPKYSLTDHLIRKLESIASLKSKIESSLVGVGWIPKLVKDALLRLTHSSTAIEGNTLSLKEVMLLSDGKDISYKSRREKQEVFNYLELMKYIENNAAHKEFKESDILWMHSIIGKKNVLDREPIGKYRNYQVYVGEYKPMSSSRVKKTMDDLLVWSNQEGIKKSPIISSAIIHYRCETIHPFGDGNGRLGRAWAIWELYRRGFDTNHIFAIDEIYLENKKKYYRSLARHQNKGENADITGWIEFVAEAIEWSLERTWKRLDKVRIDKKIVLTEKQETLLAMLRNQSMHIQDIMKELGVTKSGAHAIVKNLLENSLVERQGGYRSGKYHLIN